MMRSRVLLPLLMLAALLWLAQWPGSPALLQRVGETGPAVFLCSALGLLVSHGLRALRLHAEWHARRGVGRLECLRVALLHSAAVNLMPLRSGELGFPLLLWRRWQVPLPESAGSLLWMRLQDALVLAWLGALTAAALLSGGGPVMRAAAVALALAATGLLLLLVSRGAAWRAAPAPADGAPQWRAVLVAARAALAGATAVTWTWCVANWLVKVGVLGGLMAVLMGERGLAGWSAALGGEGAAALPVQAPAGFGTYEAAAAFGARLAGAATVEAGLAAALVVHLFTLLVTLSAALWVSVAEGLQAHRHTGPSGAA